MTEAAIKKPRTKKTSAKTAGDNGATPSPLVDKTAKRKAAKPMKSTTAIPAAPAILTRTNAYDHLATSPALVPCIDQAHGRNWSAYRGDCVEIIKGIPDESVHFSAYSPPFLSLYVYSNSERDFGNCKKPGEFFEHYSFLIRELLRVTKPGRLSSVHCMNLPTTISHHGYIGIDDFRGDIIRAHCGDEAADIHAGLERLKIRQRQAALDGDAKRLERLTHAMIDIAFELEECPPIKGGWIFHSEVCIWKDPVTAMQRTKALGLLHKQVVKDSCMSRQGIPDYLLTFRKPGQNAEPVQGEFDRWIGDDSTFKSTGKLSIDIWQRFASPVWMDINATRTLQYMQARHNDDERHIAPLQLDVVERAMEMYSNQGDVMLSPFGGIGTEGYVGVVNNRKSISIELKDTYFEANVRNHRLAEQEAKNKGRTLVDWADRKVDEAEDPTRGGELSQVATASVGQFDDL